MSLVRTLLRNGISYGEFDQVARKYFVDVAYRDLAPAGKKQTVSNVAILTGLNRKEVKKLSELDLEQSGGDIDPALHAATATMAATPPVPVSTLLPRVDPTCRENITASARCPSPKSHLHCPDA